MKAERLMKPRGLILLESQKRWGNLSSTGHVCHPSILPKHAPAHAFLPPLLLSSLLRWQLVQLQPSKSSHIQILSCHSAIRHLVWNGRDNLIFETSSTPGSCSANTDVWQALVVVGCSPAAYTVCLPASFVSQQASTEVHEMASRSTDCYLLLHSLL